MTTPTPNVEVERVLGPVKIQAAALLVGMPFYALVVVLLLTGAAQAAALGLYGVVAGGWVVWRTRRALRGLPEAR